MKKLGIWEASKQGLSEQIVKYANLEQEHGRSIDVRLKQEEDPNRYTRSWMVEVSEEVELKLLRESRWRSNTELVACSGSSITVVICR